MKNTPIEKYDFENKTFFVKREDMFKGAPYPQLAKLRGVCDLIEKLKIRGVKKIGCFDTRVSHAGWGVSAACKEHGIECHVYFPYLVAMTELAEQQKKSQELGAILHKLKGGRTAVLYSQAKKHAEINKIYMLPLGLVCQETVLNVRKEALMIPKEYKSIVVSTGTGTILSGLILGSKNRKIYAVSAGMSEKKQKKRILGLWSLANYEADFKNVHFHQADTDYYTEENRVCPFPSHEYYDRKAFKWMMENFDDLEKPVLFWNIGA